MIMKKPTHALKHPVRVITRDELRAKLERHDNFKLVMSLSEWAFQNKRIPGSIHFNTEEEMLAGLRKDEDIVVYCTNPACHASLEQYEILLENGYTNVRRYAAGISDWEAADLPLEGDWVDKEKANEKEKV